jgi:hypothetical protein
VQLGPGIVKATNVQVQAIGSVGLGYLHSSAFACAPLAAWLVEGEKWRRSLHWRDAFHAGEGRADNLGHARPGRCGLSINMIMHLLKTKVAE